MISDQPESRSSAKKLTFHKVGENQYRLESSRTYYTPLKRGGKQIRHSLKTSDPALARWRLAKLREKVARLNQTKGASQISIEELATRWLDTIRGNLKERSISRVEVCLKRLKPFSRDLIVRNLTRRHCEEWKTKWGDLISPQSYKHERRVLMAVLDYAVRDGLILENPARDEETPPTRKIPKPKTAIPIFLPHLKRAEEIIASRQEPVRLAIHVPVCVFSSGAMECAGLGFTSRPTRRRNRVNVPRAGFSSGVAQTARSWNESDTFCLGESL